jgi:hypothetical protein
MLPSLNFLYAYILLSPWLNWAHWTMVAGLLVGWIWLWGRAWNAENGIDSRKHWIAGTLCLASLLAALSPMILPRILHESACRQAKEGRFPADPPEPPRELRIRATDEDGERLPWAQEHLREAQRALSDGRLDRLEVESVRRRNNKAMETEVQAFALGPDNSVLCQRKEEGWTFHLPPTKCVEKRILRSGKGKTLSVLVVSASKEGDSIGSRWRSTQLVSNGVTVASEFFRTDIARGPGIMDVRALTCAVPNPRSTGNPLARWLGPKPPEREVTTTAGSPCGIKNESQDGLVVYEVRPGSPRTEVPIIPAILSDARAKASVIDLVIDDPGKRVALDLFSHEPVIWRIQRTKGTEVVAVNASGAHGAAVVGISRRVPVSVAGGDAPAQRKLQECAYNQIKNWILTSKVKPVFITATEPTTAIGGTGQGEKVIEKDPRMLEHYELRANIPPGITGMDQLAMEGRVIKLTKMDGLLALGWRGNLIAGNKGARFDTGAWLLLEKIELPSGLSMAETIPTIYVPSDVLLPDGDVGFGSLWKLSRTRADIVSNLHSRR